MKGGGQHLIVADLVGGFKEQIGGTQVFFTLTSLFLAVLVLTILTLTNVIDVVSNDAKVIVTVLWATLGLFTFAYWLYILYGGIPHTVHGTFFESLLAAYSVLFGVLTVLFATDTIQIGTSGQKNNLIILSSVLSLFSVVYLIYLLT